MMTVEAELEKLFIKEEALGLDDYSVRGIPMWSVIKYDARNRSLIKQGVIEKQSSIVLRFKAESLINWLKSFFSIVWAFSSSRTIENVLISFSRLERIDGVYIDKFLDPLIDYSVLNKSYICFEQGKGRTGVHWHPRYHKEKVIYSDALWLFARGLALIDSPLFLLKNRNVLKHFRESVLNVSGVDYSLRALSRTFSAFSIESNLYKFFLKKHSVKRVFGVSRVLFKPVAFAAKRCHVVVYELQHGITMGPTALYGGKYDERIDPDWFLAFGDKCPSTMFGIPCSRMVSIGFALKQYLKDRIDKGGFKTDACLVVSEPHISDQVIAATVLLADSFPSIDFHIRRHPQEQFTPSQNEIIKSRQNVQDVTSSENSMIVLMRYPFIIGENSSVLYEALSFGKKVARICFSGLNPIERNEEDAFVYLQSPADFASFLNSGENKSAEFYADFNSNLFDNLLING